MDKKMPAPADVMRLATRDPFVTSVGIRAVDAAPGRATVAMDVRPEHINFNGKCHGGAIFTLADTAFGLASNSHGLIAVGIDAHITFHVAAAAGDTLTATAAEISRTRKIAVYRIEVTRGDGALVAGFTGTVYVLAKPNKAAESAG
jgi:acyl-CoA thioesterase